MLSQASGLACKCTEMKCEVIAFLQGTQLQKDLKKDEADIISKQKQLKKAKQDYTSLQKQLKTQLKGLQVSGLRLLKPHTTALANQNEGVVFSTNQVQDQTTRDLTHVTFPALTYHGPRVVSNCNCCLLIVIHDCFALFWTMVLARFTYGSHLKTIFL